MNQRRNITILFFTMIVVMMGFGLVIPILPFYVESFGVGGWALGMLMAIFSVMQFISSPFWGNTSDRHGRKPVLLLGVFGNALSLTAMAFAQDIWMLFAVRAIGGLLSAATLPTMMAYVADSTDDEHRGGGMGIIGAAMGVGMVLGPGLGGALAERSITAPFFAAAALSLIALVLIWLILPESLPPEKRGLHVTSQTPHLEQMRRALIGPLGFLFFVSFLINFGLTSFEGIFGLFALVRFGFGPAEVGIILTLVGVISAGVQGFLTGAATKRFGENWIIKASLLGSAIGFPLMLLARDMPTVMLTVALFVFSNTMLRPAISSLISKRAEGGQGMAMGMNNAFMSLGRIVGPLWAGTLFDWNHTLPYVSGGVIMLASFLLSLPWLPTAATRPAGPDQPQRRP